jgi:ribosomal protein S15P/S13E
VEVRSSWKAENNNEEKSKMITSYESQRQLDIAAVKALILTTQITGTHTHTNRHTNEYSSKRTIIPTRMCWSMASFAVS